jgi:hypothetical protein
LWEDGAEECRLLLLLLAIVVFAKETAKTELP